MWLQQGGLWATGNGPTGKVRSDLITLLLLNLECASESPGEFENPDCLAAPPVSDSVGLGCHLYQVPG